MSEQNGRQGPSLVRNYWPVIVTAAALLVSAVRADSLLSDTKQRVEYLYSAGSPAMTPRLSHLEATQDAMKAQLDRIEAKLDKEAAK